MSDSSDQAAHAETAPSCIPKPKPSGIKPPSSSSSASSVISSSLSKVNRICSSHEKKPELPTAATPSKNVSEESEYDLLYDRFGLGSRSSKSKSQSPDFFRYSKYSPDRKSSSGFSSISPDFFEATGRRSSSDHGADLTTDTDSFMIGQRVYVGGIKSGRITFIGEVHFAPGEWAGIVLDEAEGKNDGAVSGKRYFQCEPKKGIFSRLTRLTREPLTSADGALGSDYSFRSMTSPIRYSSGNTSPTQSVSSVTKAAPTKLTPEINDRVIVKSATGSRAGILRYRGEPKFASGIWCGVEYEEAVGKNDGSVSGTRYFKCEANHGIFVPESKVVLSPLSRKLRLSRQNSQESLTSNITLGSLASTNTAKLRMSATQKRLSTLNKSPSATSTPKPSFSLQDILREKSNHIEQIMKERDFDREEMAAQTVLYQKNLNQYKEKITHLTKLLDDERKKSEDLQFTIDEAQTTADETELKDTTECTLQDKVKSLEQELKKVKTQQASGDYVDTSQHDEIIASLRIELEEFKEKLLATESLKTTLENEVQSLNEKIIEITGDLDIKSSANGAMEKVFKDEIDYLQSRVNDLETEVSSKTAEIETQRTELEKVEGSRNEELTMLENQMKEKIAAMMASENSLMQQMTDKDDAIKRLKDDIEKFTSSDVGAQEIITKKDADIQKLTEISQVKDSKIQELSDELSKKIDEVSTRDDEINNLQKSLEKIQTESENTKQTCERHARENQMKIEEISKQKVQIDLQCNEITSLKSEIESITASVNEVNENLFKSREVENELSSKLTDLSESKVKLENDLTAKDNDLKQVEEANEKLTKEIEEIKKCMSGLNAEAEGNIGLLTQKNAEIEKLTKDLNELKERSGSDLEKNEELRKSLEIQLADNQKSSSETIEKLQSEYDAEKSKLSSHISELEKIITEKDARLEVMNKNSSLLSESKENLEKTLAEIETKLSDTLSKLKQLEKDESEKSSQLERLQSTHNDILKKLQESEITAKKLQEDKNSFEIDNKDLNRKLGAQDEKITQLTEMKTKLQEELDSFKTSSLDTNSELKKLHDELKEKQSAFERFQSDADKKTLELQRRVDELENQRDSANQTCTKLKNEMDILHQQKIENENSLNLDLQNIKSSTEEERSNLEREISQLRAVFESEKSTLKRDFTAISETSERCKNELEAKIKSLKENIEDLQKELNESRNSMKQSESRLGVAIDDLKKNESQLNDELLKERDESDKLKSVIEELQAVNKIQKNEFEEKIAIEKRKIEKLEGEIQQKDDQFKLVSAGTEEKIKVLDDIQKKCYEYEEKVAHLSNQIQNEISSKVKLESNINELQKKLQEIEEEQVDLINSKEQYKFKTIELQEQIVAMKQRRDSLDEKLSLERKESELFKSESDTKIYDMQVKITELQQSIDQKDFEKDEIIKRLELRDCEKKQLYVDLKEQEEKLKKEIENVQIEKREKENELAEMANECSSKDNLLADMKNNIENLKTCLNTINSEKSSNTDLVQKLNQTLHEKEMSLSELSMKMHQLEATLNEKNDQLKNVNSTLSKIEGESKTRIADLLEQIAIIEEVKHKEVGDLSEKVNALTTKLSIYQAESESTYAHSKESQRECDEYLIKIQDLQMSETELQIQNQNLKRQLEESQMSLVPKIENADDKDLVEHIEFLNSIIADMHKKNLKLTKQLQSVETGSSSINNRSQSSISGNDFDLKFLEKKKPPPRVYCDICEIFDAHETEDCPTQCSEIDMELPAMKRKDENKERKKPPPRKYCDMCEVFDLHETEDCPANDETF